MPYHISYHDISYHDMIYHIMIYHIMIFPYETIVYIILLMCIGLLFNTVWFQSVVINYDDICKCNPCIVEKNISISIK